MALRRLVYSTDRGCVCRACGWPENQCHCSSTLAAIQEPVPEKITAKLRFEKRASGKGVTVVDGLPNNRGFLESLARELKKSCGTGGRAAEGWVELQGNQRERLRELLAKKGWKVKG